MEDIDIEYLKNLPQLIVALDSLDESANYIHISDIKDNVIYYFPCCKGVVKPRAYRNEIDYQVQPHFYHESGGCNEESFVHYICKTWLFEKGCRFIVGGNEYEVGDVDVEATLHTAFGDYRPDIIVTTSACKVFYFEIRTTNKKTDHYIPKWDELGNDVVEVDTRYFINQKCKKSIPEFSLIYSDGECFIKSYTRTDYDRTIARRKLEWKRQDKINHKIQWERLDWFWNVMQCYKIGEKTLDDVFESFEILDIFDKEICFALLKRQSCIKGNNQKFRGIINKESINFWEKKATFLIKNCICFNYIILEPKKDFYFDYQYLDCFGNKQKAFRNFYNKEWIIRPSKLLKIIKDIKNTITEHNVYEMRLNKYNEILPSVLNAVSNLFYFNKCIWDFNYHDNGNFQIGIKNGSYSYCHENGFLALLSFNKNSDVAYESLYKFCIEKIKEKMLMIHSNVSIHDGEYSEYRHMFVSCVEVNHAK